MKVLVIALLALNGVMAAPAPEPAPAPAPAPSGLLAPGVPVVTTSVITPNVVLVPAVSPLLHDPVFVGSHDFIAGYEAIYV